MKLVGLMVECDDGKKRRVIIPLLNGMSLRDWFRQPNAMQMFELLKKLAVEQSQ